MPQVAWRDPRVLVGNETHDDAGVFRLSETLALVQTVDFFTPVVDDPYQFGQIAAANALSDIYAMGGTPLTALNLLATPADALSPDVVAAMLAGGQEVMREAETSVIGGHSIDDPEPKMGYAVTGVVHPEHIWRNHTARAGDRVFVTKPIGTGVVVKAIKDGVADEATAAAAATMMRTLNRAAKEALAAVGDPTACTDVTGFGLLGHLWEMASGSGVRIRLRAHDVPLLPGALALAEAGRFPRGSQRNWEYVSPHVTVTGGVGARERLFADAVTSGGLLFTMSPDRVRAVRDSFRSRGVPLWEIGDVVDGPAGIELA